MIILFQPPCCVQGRQPAAQAAQSHIQPGLECLQGWGIHSLLGQPVPVMEGGGLSRAGPHWLGSGQCWAAGLSMCEPMSGTAAFHFFFYSACFCAGSEDFMPRCWSGYGWPSESLSYRQAELGRIQNAGGSEGFSSVQL